MRTVNIGELKNQLSGYLQHVKNGEEIVVRDRSVPVARILPFRHDAEWESEAQLVASGALKMPEEPMDWTQFFLEPSGNVSQELAIEMDWTQFFLEPSGNVSQELAIEAALKSRGDR